MALTVAQISSAETDEALRELLSTELSRIFPPSLTADKNAQLDACQKAPRGMRAMAAIYQLDVSMALDDLAWHFYNHHDVRFYKETRWGLQELEAYEAAEIFEQAYAIIAPNWETLGESRNEKEWDDMHNWFDETGIQPSIDPLNDRLWKICKQWPEFGLLHYWLPYARKYPERCVGGTPP